MGIVRIAPGHLGFRSYELISRHADVDIKRPGSAEPAAAMDAESHPAN